MESDKSPVWLLAESIQTQIEVWIDNNPDCNREASYFVDNLLRCIETIGTT
tara:strand:- start:423 stop:575 length:153 start_codon:yes stop_codon:yes gene_type:complete